MRVVIRGLSSKVDFMGAVVFFDSKVVVLMLVILRIYLFSLGVRLVNHFKELFRLLMESNWY